MGPTSPGWLNPDDLSRVGRRRRALQLLGDHLDEDQRDQAERHDGFAVTTEKHVFWIPLDGTPWCAHADDGRVEHLCIAPDKLGGMPEADVSLTYLTWIKFDCDRFLREANVLSTKTIDEWPDSDAELVRKLAELVMPKNPRPRARPPKDMRPRKPPVGLDADRIRDLFAKHDKDLSEETLRKLTGM